MVWVDKFTSGQHSGLYGACDVLHGGVVAAGRSALGSFFISRRLTKKSSKNKKEPDYLMI